MTIIFNQIIKFLENENVAFKHINHLPTYTSEESAKVREEALEIGAKALLVKVDSEYLIFVLSAAKKLDSKKIKAFLFCSSLRFASQEELWEKTSLVPGSLPPFGEPILPFKLYVDCSIESLSQVAFNAGSLTDSLVITTKDYLNICKGALFSFSK